MRQVLAWAMDHDAAVALRLAVALAPWWRLRGRLAGQYPLLREAAGRAVPGSDGWCAAQFWLGIAAAILGRSGRGAGPFHRAPRRRRGPAAVPGAGRLPWQPVGDAAERWAGLAEAAEDGRRSLALARELGYPAGEALALADLSHRRLHADDRDSAVRLARQAEQITADIPGWLARSCSNILTGGADRGRGPGRRRARLRGGPGPVPGRGRPAERDDVADADGDPGPAGGPRRDAAAHLREALQIAARTGSGLTRSTAWSAAGTCAPRPGAPPRPSRCGPLAAALAARGVHGGASGCTPPTGTPAQGPASARTRPGAGGRGPRRGDEPGHRRRVRPHAHRPRPGATSAAPRREGGSAPGNGS